MLGLQFGQVFFTVHDGCLRLIEIVDDRPPFRTTTRYAIAIVSGRCATIIRVNWIPLIAVDQLLTLDMEVTRHLINESDCLIEAAYRQNSWHDSMRSCK